MLHTILDEIGERLSLIYLGKNDFVTHWDLKKIINNKEKIIEYYEKKLKKIETIDDYIDYLVLMMLNDISEMYYENVDSFPLSMKEFFEKIGLFFKEYKTKELIVFLNDNIDLVFRSDADQRQLSRATKPLIIKFQSGIKEQTFKKICDISPCHLFDVYSSSGEKTKKAHSLNRMLFNKNTIPALGKFRLEELLDCLKKIHEHSKSDVAEALDTIVEIMRIELSETDLQHKMMALDRIEKTYIFLKEIKDPRAKEFEEFVNNKETLITEWLKRHGQEYSHSVDLTKIVEYFRSDTNPVVKFTQLTHRHDGSNLVSYLDEGPGEPSLVDYVRDSDPTDDFFTGGHKAYLLHTLQMSSRLTSIIIIDNKLFRDFVSVILGFIDEISKKIKCGDSLTNDANLLFASVEELISEGRQRGLSFIQTYGTAVFICAQIESILREVAFSCRNRDDPYVDFSTLSLEKLLNEGIIKHIMGENMCKNLGYFLLKKEKIGMDMRNNLCHWKDRPEEVNIEMVSDLLYLYTQVVNSIFFFILTNDTHRNDDNNNRKFDSNGD